MNNRDYKEFAPGSYYHVYNRGNGKQDIFLDKEDYNFFLFRLKEALYPDSIEEIMQKKDKEKKLSGDRRTALPKGSFDLVCYCLMPNHYHFLIKQNNDISIAKLIAKVCTGYSKYLNKKYSHAGHVFQDRFRAVIVDSNEYIVWLSGYIHDNPKTAGLVQNLIDYPWSSYFDYIGLTQGDLCKKDIILDQFENANNYKRYVHEVGKLVSERKIDSQKLKID